MASLDANERGRLTRLRLYGAGISLYFPLTTRWLPRRRDITELDFYAELTARLDGWSSTLWNKVNDAYSKLVAEGCRRRHRARATALRTLDE